MKREFFLQAISQIDDDLICEAVAENTRNKANAENKVKILPWRWIGTAAAVFLVACGVWIAAASGRLDIGLNDDAAFDAAPAEPGDGAMGESYTGGSLADYDKSESKNESPAEDDAADTEGIRVTEVHFQIWKNGGWSTVTKPYPDGLPDAAAVIGDYLTAAGSDVRCVSVKITSTPSVTVTSGEIVSHTPGIRTAAVVFTADPGDDVLRGLLRTVPQLGLAQYFRLYTEDGTELTIGDTLPPEGYEPRDFLD